jgi:Tfp pilus assembly protein PilP
LRLRLHLRLRRLLPALGVLTMSVSASAANPPDPVRGAAGGAGGTAAGGSAVVDAATAKRLATLHKKVLKDEDFVENDETNRDPFHSYMRLFVDHGAAKTHKVSAVFDKVALDELSLIAIISGDESPRAMFRDATGFGQAVQKGEFLSRAAARVTKILSDRVIVEISETTGSGETRVIEKAILVNPGEAP